MSQLWRLLIEKANQKSPQLQNFRNAVFRQPLQKIFPQNVHDFFISCSKVLNYYAPRKKKYVRGNHSLFMNKNFSTAIMLRTKLTNIFLKNRTEENKGRYIKQWNLCVTFCEKVRENIIITKTGRTFATIKNFVK